MCYIYGGDIMKYVKTILERLKNPVVVTSIISQVLIILSVFKLKIDTDLITKAVLAVGSILVSLGIFNNPAQEVVITEKLKCEHCNKLANHVLVADNFICQECGCCYSGECEIKGNKKIIK